MTDLAVLVPAQRRRLVEFIGDQPDAVLAVHAVDSRLGRVWLDGDHSSVQAVMVESRLVPGEPMGFGEPLALLGLLREADGWDCIELETTLADTLHPDVEHEWGPCRRVIDVIHTLTKPAPARSHPLVRRIEVEELEQLTCATDDLLPELGVTRPAVEQGRVFAAFDHGVVVGHGSSFAASDAYADVGVNVDERYRRQGVARAAAALACAAVQRAGLTPVWGTSSTNIASLATANALGFVEIARLTYLVPEGRSRSRRADP